MDELDVYDVWCKPPSPPIQVHVPASILDNVKRLVREEIINCSLPENKKYKQAFEDLLEQLEEA